MIIHRLTVAEPVEKVRTTMKKFLPVFICLSLSVFTLARVTKPAPTLAPGTKTTQEESPGQEAHAKLLLKSTTPSEEVASDHDDNANDASGDQGEDMDDDSSDAVGDEGTGADDDEGDDGSGDEGE